MKYMPSLSKIAQAENLIHTEHGESINIIRSAQTGGAIAGVVILVTIVAIFAGIHINGASQHLSWPGYIIWALAGMVLTFAAAIVGMLIGMLYSEIQVKRQIWLRHNEAVAGALVELNIRQKVRKVLLMKFDAFMH